MKKLEKILLIGIVILVALGLTGCGTTTVELNKYIKITTDGYNTMGTATYAFDEEAFENDYFGKIEVKQKDNIDVEDALSENSSVSKALLATCVSEHLDKSSDLENGQKITLVWECNDELAKKAFGVKLEYSNIEQEVSELKEIKEFNPFDYMKISFSGKSPNGEAKIDVDYSREEMQYIQFSADRLSNLKEDNVVIVDAVVSSEEDFIEKFGEKISETRKSYSVSGLDKYVTDSSQIPKDMYNKMDSYLQDELKSEVANDWTDVELKSVKLIGNYTLSLKDGMEDWDGQNYVYFVYKVKIRNKELEKDISYYWYGYYTDVLLLGDGTCSVDLSSYQMANPESDDWEYDEEVEYADGYKYYGFKDIESLFNKRIISKSNKYNYTESIEE